MEYFFYFFFFITLYFQIYLLWNYLESLQTEEGNAGEQKENTQKHFLSTTIIVPCFNEEQTVEKTVHSLLALNYPKEKLRIFIVDDGSTDRTWDVIQQFRADPRVRLFQKENEGSKFAALNYALRFVETELVGVLDADSWVDPNALQYYMEHFSDPEVMAVIPSMLIAEPDNLIRRAQKVEYEVGIFVRKVLAHIGAIYIAPGPFSVFRKYVFDTLGPYREAHHTEDAEIALRMQKHGYKIAYHHRALVYTVGPKTIPALIKQRVRWTYGFVRNALDYRKLLFRKRYGELGSLVLPMGIFRVFFSVFLFTLSVYLFLEPLKKLILKWEAVGMNASFSFPRNFHFDPFYFHVSTLSLLSILGFILMYLTLRFSSRILEREPASFTDFLSLIFLYTFIAPIWLFRTVFNVFRAKTESWR